MLYRNNLKNREFGKEAAQIFDLERATIVRAQGASEDQKFAAKLTRPKTDSSSCFGIKCFSSFRVLLSFALSLFLISSLNATTIEDSDDIDQKDINALREWINTKRQVTVKELGGALSVSGEVRTEFQATSETLGSKRQRGRGAPKLVDKHSLPTNAYDIEVNIMLDYRADRSWASIKLEFDNDAGIFSGTLNKLKLERAYWGVRLIDSDQMTTDIEVGRRRMSSLVDSKVEFNNFFDGIWFKYEHSLQYIADVYLHTGIFLINENNNQYGYMGEIGMLNISGTGLYTKYSLIDWNTKTFQNKIKRRSFRFLVSQFLAGYRFYPSYLNKIVLLYAAGLYNHAAKSNSITNHKKANWGAYLGLSIGELKKKGDWAFDINYQVVAAQCIPDFDVQGIGLGNAANTGLFSTNIKGGGKPTTYKNAGGNTNYRGFQMTLDWLLTNQLDFQQSWQQSISLDNHIGKFHRFKQYEIEFIYGF